MDDAVEGYLTELAGTEHGDRCWWTWRPAPQEHGFPIIGRATGRTWSWPPARSAPAG